MSAESKQKSSCFQTVLVISWLLQSPFSLALIRSKTASQILTKNVLQEVAQRNIAKYENNTRLPMQGIAEDLNKEYPGHVALKEEWVFSNAGGAMDTALFTLL